MPAYRLLCPDLANVICEKVSSHAFDQFSLHNRPSFARAGCVEVWQL